MVEECLRNRFITATLTFVSLMAPKYIFYSLHCKPRRLISVNLGDFWVHFPNVDSGSMGSTVASHLQGHWLNP